MSKELTNSKGSVLTILPTVPNAGSCSDLKREQALLQGLLQNSIATESIRASQHLLEISNIVNRAQAKLEQNPLLSKSQLQLVATTFVQDLSKNLGDHDLSELEQQLLQDLEDLRDDVSDQD